MSALLLTGVAPLDAAGERVTGIGDFNGDGFDDLIVAASQADPFGDRSGRVFVVFGRPDPQLRRRDGFFLVSLRPGGHVDNADFGNRPIPATLRGTVFRDLNSNVTRDAGEAGIADFQIYLDLNNDGSLTNGEPTTTSDVIPHAAKTETLSKVWKL